MTRKHLIIILTVTVTVRFLSSWFVNDFQPAVWEYENLADSLISKNEYSMSYREYGEYQALLAPGYTFLTYGVYQMAGKNHILMLIIQYFLMFAAAIAMYKISFEIFNKPRLAFITSLLFSLHPGFIHYSSNNLHQLCLYIPLFYWSIFCLIKISKKADWKYFLLLGFAGGCAMQTRATILPVICLSLLIIIFLKRDCLKELIPKACLSLFILFLINTPWTVRNYNLFGKIVFSQTNKWESFWVGNNINASGGHWDKNGRLVLSQKPPEMQKEIDESESEILDNEIFKKYSMEYVKENPGHFAKGLVRKGIFFWWFHTQTGILYPPKVVLIAKFLYFIFLSLTLYGLYLCGKKKLFSRYMIFPGVLVLGIWAVHTLYFMEMRHRMTIEPVMMLFAVLPLMKIKWLAEKSSEEEATPETPPQ